MAAFYRGFGGGEKTVLKEAGVCGASAAVLCFAPMVMMRSGQPPASNVRGRAWRRFAFGCFVALGLSTSCGGESVSTSDDGDGGEGAEGAVPSAGTTGSGGTTGGTGIGGFGGSAGVGTGGSAGSPQTGGSGGEPPVTDPGCPDTPAPPGVMQCNVFGTPTGCGPGEGCYPTIDHPFGMGCDQQVHGSRCALSGSGSQGDFCPGGTLDCASGFICIVGAQIGSRCMRMCAVDGSMPCPSGLFCGETDARGVGVCA